jgi:hypothetical protein
MSGINGFPDDDNLWLVKWIDQIRLPHLSTKSASFSVLLQKLRIHDPKLVHALNTEEIQAILSPPEGEEFKFTRHLVGLFPSIEIGAVFQSKNKVAQLPDDSLTITLPFGEQSCSSENFLDLREPPSIEWPTKMPYRLINRFEYFVEKSACHDSQCLVFRTDITEYIIPRSVIFKTFYALNRRFAQAFTNGPWPSQCETLVCMKELESGLKTEIDAETGSWNVVLQLNVPSELTPLLGIYIFDDYGRTCATSIHSSMFKSRQKNAYGGWFIDAKIPFSVDVENPLKLSVQGFKLKKYKHAPADSLTKFLVTKINSSSLPKLPPLRCAYVVSGQQGREKINVDEPAPFSNMCKVKPGNASTTIDSNTDANTTHGSEEIVTSSFFWIDPPPMQRMQKALSKSYNSPVKGDHLGDNVTNVVSPGNNTYSAYASAEAQIKTLIRQPDKLFENLLETLLSLKKDSKIYNYTIIAPIQHLQGIEIGGVRCWNFLDEDARSSGNWPKKGWRMKKHADKQAEGGLRFGQPRAALVVRIDYSKSQSGHWIEIEQKSTSYRSPYITKLPNDVQEIMQHLIEIIARNEAKNLISNLDKGVAELDLIDTPMIRAYKHGYKKGTHGDLSHDSVLAFLRKSHKREN